MLYTYRRIPAITELQSPHLPSDCNIATSYLRVFEKSVLRMTFGPKRDDITGNWRKLHNEDPPDLYFSPYVIGVIESRIRWGKGVGIRGNMKRNAKFGGDT